MKHIVPFLLGAACVAVIGATIRPTPNRAPYRFSVYDNTPKTITGIVSWVTHTNPWETVSPPLPQHQRFPQEVGTITESLQKATVSSNAQVVFWWTNTHTGLPQQGISTVQVEEPRTIYRHLRIKTVTEEVAIPSP